MATPATFSDPVRETQGPDDKAADAYEKRHDADDASDKAHATSNLDVEKGVQSAAISTNSDDRTLEGDPTTEAERDPDIVDWDGPDDPENPLNWPARRKWTLIFILAMVTLVTWVLLKPLYFHCSRS
jgi:hypothetical protein